MSDTLRVNGNVVSWGSFKFKLSNGLVYKGITEIAWGEKLESVLVYGQGRHQAPQGGTAGKYTPDMVTGKARYATAMAMKRALAQLSPSGTSYGYPRFSCFGSYVEPAAAGSLGETHKAEFFGCKWVESKVSNTEGSDPTTVEFSLQVLAIREDGLALYDDSEGSPY